MGSIRRIGIGLAAVSVLGYAIGVAAPYPGRSASLVGLMVGVTLYAIGYGDGESV
jgi:hypothetical protein